MIEFSWNPEYAHFIAAVLWSAVGFASYYFLSLKKTVGTRIWIFNQDLDDQVKEVVLQRFWGFLFLGITSTLIILIFLNVYPWVCSFIAVLIVLKIF